MTRTPSRRTLVAASILALGLFGLPAMAETYHVNLVNGAKFDSRYPPEEASWDANTLLFITATGNWIGVTRDQIELIQAEVENRGHGQRLNATTIYMGRAPNANQSPEELAAGQNPQLQLLQRLLDQQAPQRDYTVDQFVDPSEAGKGGLPAGYGGAVTPPLSGTGLPVTLPVQVPTSVQPVQPPG